MAESVSISFLAAGFIAVILPSLFIDPVTSSASATRMRWRPHVVVELVPMSSLGNPATFMKLVGTLPDPSILIVAFVEPLEGV
jgi:hypothetical protein